MGIPALKQLKIDLLLLKSLTVSNSSLEDRQVAIIVDCIPKLEMLDLSNNNIRAIGAQKLAGGLKYLKHLNLSICFHKSDNNYIKDDGVIYIINSLPSLTELHVSNSLLIQVSMG